MIIQGYNFRELVVQDLREMDKWLRQKSKRKSQQERIADVGETEVMLYLLKLTCDKNATMDDLAGVIKMRDLEALIQELGVPFPTGGGLSSQ